MKKINTKQMKPCTHLAGEFFVAAELSRMGYNVALTMGNAKRVDLIIENNDATLPVQVKALSQKKNVGWPLNLEVKYKKSLIFALVVLGPIGQKPDYYILDGAEVEKRRKNYKTRSILDISTVKEFKDNWQLINKRIG